jgi:hypothetical protein
MPAHGEVADLDAAPLGATDHVRRRRDGHQLDRRYHRPPTRKRTSRNGRGAFGRIMVGAIRTVNLSAEGQGSPFRVSSIGVFYNIGYDE